MNLKLQSVRPLVQLSAWIILLAAWAPWAAPAAALTISPGVQVGTISSATLSETSGVVASRSMPGVLWVHNDSGDSARFYAISTAGNLLGTFPLSGATAVDWEDIAIGPKAGGGNYLYLGDIGDNDSLRPNVSIYRLDEPNIATGATIAAADYTKVTFQYPGGARNAESLMIDPWNGDAWIVTKATSPQVYRLPASAFDNPSQVSTLQLLGHLGEPLNKPSAADISPDGTHILIRDRSTTAYLYERHAGQSVWDAVQGAGIAVTLRADTQGEAIGWAADGSGFYTASEWADSGPQPIYFYAFHVPEPAGWQLGLAGLVAIGGHLLVRRRRGLAR